MKPFTLYYFQQEALSTGQQQRVTEMVAIANPEAIYLLGASQRSRRSERIFKTEAPSARYIADCFYLVLLPDDTGKSLQQWEDQLEHAVGGFPFTIMALFASRFLNWLSEGHPFAGKVHETAPLLYKSSGSAISDTQSASHTATVEIPEKEYAAAVNIANAFMAGALLYAARKEFPMWAFMLHQAAEQALRALLKAGTGYQANGHNIERLFRYGVLVSWQLPEVFNLALPADQRLLNLLQKAYIGARYEKGFTVKAAELDLLHRKVQQVIRIAAQVGLQCIRQEAVTFVQPDSPQ